MAAQRVAVAGGGLAGLAAATELQRSGIEVHLFERSRLLGGRATSFEVDGCEVDNGQHVYLACCDRFVEFVERAGMGGALQLQDRFDVTVFYKGVRSELRAANLPPPFHLLAAMISYRHLSVPAKLQLARALRAIAKNTLREGEQRFGDWLRSQGQGEEAIRAFWEPFMVPALNVPLDRMDAAEAAFVISTAFLHDRNAARIGFSKVPLARIMEAAAEKLFAVHRSAPVASVRTQDNGIAVELTGGEREVFDAIVLALPPRAVAKVLGDPLAYGLNSLDAYEPGAIMDVHLWHDAGELDFDFAALLGSPVQWIFQKSAGYVCCSLSAADAMVAEPSKALVEKMWREVSACVPQLAHANLVRGAATRNPEGTYTPRAGTVRPSARTTHAAVAIAGSWTATGWPDTMESAVRSGTAAARILIEENKWIAH